MPSLSVIIPTFRRPNILRLCLRCLEAQTVADELEVIVVSDGPDPETAKLFQRSTNYQLPTTNYFEIPKSQQGVARNFGVKHAHAPFVLFIGDDILLERNACENHLAAHYSTPEEINRQSPIVKSPIAVLGFVTWDPVVGSNPVMRWLERSGWQFGYPKIAKYAHAFLPTKIQEHFTYTSHISVPTDVAHRFRFREDMTLYGWEDIEWGRRMKKAGIRLFYEPDAKALHHHHMTLEQSLARMETLGRSLVLLARQVPDFRKQTSAIKRLALRARSLLPTMNGVHRRAFLRGIRKAMRNRSPAIVKR
ncbi:MAG: glycosyltransferase [Candidatus Peribacteraceae bacterium]|nr:glycosyltransferase [Candidatus Peribacteraceae bacterium]MDD5739749.1 glycosyltransferase [Candidatus Peribacteraceae bacterium]